MTQEINDIIKKNLPAQVGEVLKERLEQAEKDANSIKVLTDVKISNEAIIKGLQNEIQKYQQFDVRNSNLDVRQKQIEEGERNLKIAELEFKLASEKEKTEFTKSVALGLVRNTEYKKTIFDSENMQPYMDNNGNWIYPAPINKSFNETKTKE